MTLGLTLPSPGNMYVVRILQFRCFWVHLCQYSFPGVGSYNAVNGVPTCANPALNQTLRGDWGFEGYVTSDTDACGDIQQGHNCGIDHFPAKPTNGTDASTHAV